MKAEHSEILAVIERTEGSNTPEINYITTEYAFLNPRDDPEFSPVPVSVTDNIDHLIHSALTDEQMPKGYTYQKDSGSPLKRYSILRFSLEDPVEGANNLSKFFHGAWNSREGSGFEVAPERCSAAAVASLNHLLEPFESIDELTKKGFGDYLDKRDSALTKNVENVLVKLGLMTVERHRMSVTQGGARVKVSGKEIIDYGDEIWLRNKNGSLTNGFKELPSAPMYGPVIGNWGSITPDDIFRRAAIMQRPHSIVKVLSQLNHDKLQDMIQSASERSDAQAAGKSPSKENVKDFF